MLFKSFLNALLGRCWTSVLEILVLDWLIVLVAFAYPVHKVIECCTAHSAVGVRVGGLDRQTRRPVGAEGWSAAVRVLRPLPAAICGSALDARVGSDCRSLSGGGRHLWRRPRGAHLPHYQRRAKDCFPGADLYQRYPAQKPPPSAPGARASLAR